MEKEDCLSAHMENLRRAKEFCDQRPQGVLVLDEAVGACRKGLLDEQELLAFLYNRPSGWRLCLPDGGLLRRFWKQRIM